MTAMQSDGTGTVRVEPVAGREGGAGGLRVLAPVMALVLVVGAAWAGSARPATIAVVDAADQGGGVASPGGTSATRLVDVPATALGLPVRTAADVAAARAAGRIRGELVAVAATLRSDPLPLHCGAIRQTLSRDFCLRLVALFPLVAASASAAPARSGGSPAPAQPFDEPSVDAIVAPGVALPPIVVFVSDLAPWLTGNVPVVFIGHYEDERAPVCPGSRGWCREQLVLERLVWMDGRDVAPGIAWDPALEAAVAPVDGAAAAAARAWLQDRRAEVLSTSVVAATGLKGVVDQPLRDGGRLAADAAWWYVRAMRPASLDGPAAVTWVVVDARTGSLLAAGA